VRTIAECGGVPLLLAAMRTHAQDTLLQEVRRHAGAGEGTGIDHNQN
jgi:hypothetical protein